MCLQCGPGVSVLYVEALRGSEVRTGPKILRAAAAAVSPAPRPPAVVLPVELTPQAARQNPTMPSLHIWTIQSGVVHKQTANVILTLKDNLVDRPTFLRKMVDGLKASLTLNLKPFRAHFNRYSLVCCSLVRLFFRRWYASSSVNYSFSWWLYTEISAEDDTSLLLTLPIILITLSTTEGT
ncbi:hypothetical protein J6590_033340 [Homalodisca vitripennis]|nr:hypothetical protein J6590_033340 [Homalodisca vitripennis]